MSRERDRRRCPNFHYKESKILKQLVKKYTDILENKLTDKSTNIKKKEAWRKLTKEFNSQSSFQERSVENLQNWYKNFKLRASRSLEQAAVDTDASTGTEDSEHDSLENEEIWEYDSAEKEICILEESSNQLPEPVESLHNEGDLLMVAEKSAKPLPQLEVTEITEWSNWLKSQGRLENAIKREKSPSSWKDKKKIRLESQDKLLQSKLELVELIKKHTETEAQLKQDILKEQLKQEKIKTATLQLKLNKTVDT